MKKKYKNNFNKDLINSLQLYINFDKNIGYYYDLHVQSDTLMLVDVFENFRSKCIEIHEVDPTHILSAPGLARQV